MEYDEFYKFYDSVMGDQRKRAKFLIELIREHNPSTKDILELACGTGAIMKILEKNYNVSGIDISKKMLSIAKKKLKSRRLYNQKMESFHVNSFFDTIICIYDSINHLKKISDWDRTFKRVKKHLKQGGVFIFDMNTLRKLNDLSNKPTTVSYFEDNIMLLKVTKEKPSIFNWNLKIFEEYKKEKNRLHEENIKETSFPIKKIKKILSNYFSNISIIDSKMRVASENSDRVYFICK